MISAILLLIQRKLVRGCYECNEQKGWILNYAMHPHGETVLLDFVLDLVFLPIEFLDQRKKEPFKNIL
jgi:hypothetical protein